MTQQNELSWTRKMSLTLEDLFRSNANQFQAVTESNNNHNSQTNQNSANNASLTQEATSSKSHFQSLSETPFLQTIGGGVIMWLNLKIDKSFESLKIKRVIGK